MFEEKKPVRAGFGSARFIIRGGSGFSLERAALLRPFYNEYPERFPINPAFPRAGRRAGSRAPGATGEGGAGGGAGEGSGELAPGDYLYPEPRDRGAFTYEGSLGGVLPAGAVPPGCGITRGGMWRSSPQVGAGAVTIEKSGVIARPFKVVHISHWAECTTPTGSNMNLRVFISDSSSTVDAPADLGQELPLAHPVGGATPWDDVVDLFPSWIVSESNKRIGARWFNNSGAALETYFTIEWEYLD